MAERFPGFEIQHIQELKEKYLKWHDLYVIYSINATRDISKLSQISLTTRKIMYNNFDISLVIFVPNITRNHAIFDTTSSPTVFKLKND